MLLNHFCLFFKYLNLQKSQSQTGSVHKYLNFYSLKNLTTNYYKETLKQTDFPNYKTFSDVDEACSNFFEKLMTVIDKIAPYKSK